VRTHPHTNMNLYTHKLIMHRIRRHHHDSKGTLSDETLINYDNYHNIHKPSSGFIDPFILDLFSGPRAEITQIITFVHEYRLIQLFSIVGSITSFFLREL
jgi:hypothetical protein